MVFTRKNLWRLGDNWNDTMLWYARAVLVMQSRPTTDPTSWNYLAAMHGFNQQLWIHYGYIKSNTPLPSTAARQRDWDQCQHQTAYFLPWHRGYLASFEAIVRDCIVKLHGPADWALPYWDYNEKSNPKARQLPKALTDATMPGNKPNPLANKFRFGRNGSGTVDVNPNRIRLNCLTEREFLGVASGGSAGFGGVPTSFQHQGGVNGMLESEPHNNVHVEVGGQSTVSPFDRGLMSMPVTAALDPVFWLHHANIDRLWEVWLKRDARHKNPTNPAVPKDKAWLDGPTGAGVRKFVVPDIHGHPVTFTPHDMLNTQAHNLNYVYQDTSDPLGGVRPLVVRANNLSLAAAPPVTEGVAEGVTVSGPAELVGASESPLQLGATAAETRVRLDRPTTEKVTNSLRAFAAATEAAGAAEPDRIFLNLENVRTESGGGAYDVYVALPPGADPAAHPENFAGTLSLFGVQEATVASGPHAGNGVTTVLDITAIVDRLHLQNALDVEHLPVRFVPAENVAPGHTVSVGRVSIYRQAP
jgi:tyrosinase